MEGETEVNERREQWLERLGNELIKLEPLMPSRLLPEEEGCPEWAERVEREVGAVMFPQARPKEGPGLTPQRMGALLGHECAQAVWLMEWFEAQASVVQNVAAAAPEEGLARAEAASESIIGKWYPAMRRLAKFALCSSVDQGFEDMSEFLLAFAKAFASKPKSFKVGEMGNPTFEIYVFMLIYWRVINSLKSVRELHELLIRVFGVHRVGELKRVEKICQRMGLHYRKPGRPKPTP